MTLPQNLAAEASVLGAIFFENLVYDRIADLVRADDFYGAAHRAVFRACVDLIGAGKTADGITLTSELADDPDVRDAGGARFLAGLLEAAAVGPEVLDYAREIAKLAKHRRLMVAADRLKVTAGDLTREPDETCEAAILEMVEAVDTGASDDEWSTAADSVKDALTALDEHAANGTTPGLQTGIDALDGILGGFYPGDLIVLGGASSMGKTATAINLGFHVAERGKRVAFFSQEMTKEQLAYRAASRSARLLGLGHIPYQRIKENDISVAERRALREAISGLPKTLMWNPARGLTVEKIRSLLRKARRKLGGVDLVIIDYLQIMQIQINRGENRTTAIGHTTMALKRLAADFGVPVILLSQLSRGVDAREGHRPRLSDLRESGSIEQDADTVMFAYRQAYYLERSEPSMDKREEWAQWNVDHNAAMRRLDLIVAKQRMGVISTAQLYFDSATDVLVNHVEDLPTLGD